MRGESQRKIRIYNIQLHEPQHSERLKDCTRTLLSPQIHKTQRDTTRAINMSGRKINKNKGASIIEKEAYTHNI